MATVREWLFPTGTELTSGESLTIGLTYFTVGLTVAVLHVTDGTAPWVMIASVFIVNSVTPTLAYAAVTASGGSTAAGVLSGWLVSTRFGLFAAAIAPRLWRSKTKRAIAAHASFDPNVALAMREKDDDDARRVYLATSLWLCIPWWIGGIIGTLIGSGLSDPGALGLDAVFPAALIAIIWPQLAKADLRVIAATAVVIAIALLEATPGGVPVLAAAGAALLALRRGR
ncbi:MAG: AzlC family ABC transporter permease [Acidimicrobiales bacterium]